jgi:hypothetical protein
MSDFPLKNIEPKKICSSHNIVPSGREITKDDLKRFQDQFIVDKKGEK